MVINVADAISSLKRYITSIDVDPGLAHAYLTGLMIGFLIVTTLTIFPGEPWGIKYGKESARASGGDTATSIKTGKQTCPSEEKSYSQLLTQRNDWVGDNIPKEKLEKVRQKFGLTPDQMKMAINDARHEALSGRRLQGKGDGRKLHHQINAWVYILILVALVYLLNVEYKSFATRFLVRMFPKEAALLGLSQ